MFNIRMKRDLVPLTFQKDVGMPSGRCGMWFASSGNPAELGVVCKHAQECPDGCFEIRLRAHQLAVADVGPPEIRQREGDREQSETGMRGGGKTGQHNRISSSREQPV